VSRIRARADEQLAARDLARADPELHKRFGKGTRYDLKARPARGRPHLRACVCLSGSATREGAREAVPGADSSGVRMRVSVIPLRSRRPQVVLRGDIGTGKSALLKRLRGGGFTAAYEPRRVPHARSATRHTRTHTNAVIHVSGCCVCLNHSQSHFIHSFQISTAKISWKCASAPDDVITLEAWDVVDRCARGRDAPDGAALQRDTAN
jgi:hypothetical protein